MPLFNATDDELNSNDEADTNYEVPTINVDEDSLTIDVYGSINLKLFADFRSAFSLLARKFSRSRLKNKHRRWITINIISRGGAAFVGLALYDSLRNSGLPIKTVALGETASVAFLIFLAGETRLMYEHAFLYFHEISTAYNEPGKQAVLNSMRNVDKYNELYAEITLANSRLTKKQYMRLMKSEKNVWADEAVEFGLAHKIIKNSDYNE